MGGIMTDISMNQPDTVFVDTSALYALFNVVDVDHVSALACMHELINDHSIFIISNFIIDEIYTLLLTKSSRSIAITAVEYLLEEWIVERVKSEDEKKALAIIKLSNDKTYSFTDATSFALIERLGISRTFSFDKHFSQYGLTVLP